MASQNRLIYQEFGNNQNSIERPTKVIPPQEQNLRIQASRRGRKGKTVTIISGITGEPDVLENILKQLKNLCGAGGAIKSDSGKNDSMEIEIQGDHAAKILQTLIALGYKAKISGG